MIPMTTVVALDLSLSTGDARTEPLTSVKSYRVMNRCYKIGWQVTFSTSRHNFIEDKESHVLYGPLLVTRFANSGDEDSWRDRLQQYAFEPVNKRTTQDILEFLADEQYATLRIPISIDIEERIINGKGDVGARRLLDTNNLNLRAVQSEIIDLATDRELER